MRWFRTRRDDEDFRREIEAHITLETERLVADGLSPADARRAAARRFGNVTLARERFFESRRVPWLDDLRQDLWYALRGLRRAPGFAGVAVLTLALGVGATTGIFSVLNAVLLRPLPYRDSDSLVLVETSPLVLAAPWATEAWRDRARTIRDFTGFNGPRSATLVVGSDSISVDSAVVTANFLSFLGVAPVFGRDFTARDGLEGAPQVALLDYGLWQSRFGADPAVPGTTVNLGGSLVTVVGVTPRDFHFPTAGALPANALPEDTEPDILLVAPPSAGLNVIARLAPGATPGTATEELLGVFRQAARSDFAPSLVDRLELRAAPLQERLAGDTGERLWLALAAAAFVLLVASANVGNLLLARASTRRRELVVRAALGARRGRLVRLLLAEGLSLSLLSAVVGLAIAFAMTGVARWLLAGRLPLAETISIDGSVLLFAAAVAVATGVGCGLASIPAAVRIDLAGFSGDGGTPTVSSRTVVGRVLLSTQVAVTFVLVVAAALLAQTFWNLWATDRGFDATRVMTVRVSAALPRLDPADPTAGQTYFAELFTTLALRMASVDGVASAAAVSSVPLAGLGAGFTDVSVEGQPPLLADDAVTPVAAVSPSYFATLRIPLLAGRDFDERDRVGSDKVVVVNDAFRRRFAPSGNIVGSRIRAGDNLMTVVGVVGDVPDRSLREAAEPLVFLALRQMPMHPFGWGQFRLVLRADRGEPLDLAPAVRREIWSTDPVLVIDEVATMAQRVSATLRAERDSALLFGLSALVALALAAIGAYGVAAHGMAQRTREIGIRVALGARGEDVVKLAVSQTLWPAAFGVAIGIGAAALLARFLGSLVYGVTPLDPPTFAVAAGILVSASLAATFVPARRAARVDPLLALRCE